MPGAGLKAAALLFLIFLLIAGTAFAASFHDLKKHAALQKIRPELLQAIEPQKGDGRAPLGAAPLGGRIAPNAAIAKAVKVKNGKIKVLLNLENNNQLDSLEKAIEAKGGKISGKFSAGKTIAAEQPTSVATLTYGLSQAKKSGWLNPENLGGNSPMNLAGKQA